MNRTIAIAILFMGLASLFAAAQDTAAQAVTVLGTQSHLTDAEGRSLYVFGNDVDGVSSCYDECAVNWPPLLVEGEPVAGQGVAASLLGTTERSDGTRQVTYSGMPLYYFMGDEAPGDTTGHGRGGVWLLLSAYGTTLAPPADATGPAPEERAGHEDEMDPMMLATLKGEGADIFAAHCAECHGDRGQGGAAPALGGNDALANTERIVNQILRGSRYMPRFDTTLTDREIAAVATFIRTSWGNEFGPVSEERVAEQ